MSKGLVVVGGGLAAAKAVAAYREAGGDERVTMLSADTRPPVHRPPLSKRFLRGETEAEDAYVLPEAWYAENGVDLRLGTRVARVAGQELELEGGERVPWERLVVASGARPRRLDVPGGDLDGVFSLRWLDDAIAIRERARASRRAVVVGGSFVGSEVAASLRTLGLEVTLVHRGPGLFDVLRVPELSAFLGRLYAERGAELALEDGVAAVEGDGRVERVRTTSGRVVDADLVVAGVGVVPSVEWLEGSGVEVDDGVVVDERYASSRPSVWAIGDVASFHDPVAGRRRRIEHWSNASLHGTQLGRVLAGGDEGYDVVASFFSEVFGTTFKVFGDTAVADGVQVRGSFDEGAATALYTRGRQLVGALALGQDEETEAFLKEAIRHGDEVSAPAGV